VGAGDVVEGCVIVAEVVAGSVGAIVGGAGVSDSGRTADVGRSGEAGGAGVVRRSGEVGGAVVAAARLLDGSSPAPVEDAPEFGGRQIEPFCRSTPPIEW
jgi:hypothetical protein